MCLSDIRDPPVAPIVISFSDREGNKAIQVPAGLRDNIFTCALKVKIVAIIGVVVRVTPSPAGACVCRHTLCFTLHNTALLLETTLDILTGIFLRQMQEGELSVIKYTDIYIFFTLHQALAVSCAALPVW